MKAFLLLLIFPILLFSNNKPVTLQLKWKHQFQFAGFYMAKELGYYQDAGLDVSIKDGFKKDSYHIVESQEAEYGVASSSLIYEYLKGRPFTALAVIFQNSPMVWLTRKDSNITKPSDFIGKTVMYNSHNLDNLELMAIFKQEGIDTKQINFIPSSYSPQDLIDKKCDAYSAFRSNEPFALKTAGVDFHEIFPITYGLDFYGDILFTHSDYAKKHPQEVKAFRDASLKGWEYAFNHIEETAQLIHSKYASHKTMEHLLFEAKELKKQSLYPFVPLGHMNFGRFEHIAKTFQKANVINDATLSKDFMFSPDVNKDIVLLKYILMVAGGIIISLAFVLLFLRQYGLKLRKEVKEQTKELRQLNEHLEERIHERTQALENAMQKAESANASKSRFLANMSHEIRTPLNAIVGFINILQKDETDKTRQHYLDVIESSSHSLLGIINDILDLSKIEGGKLDVDLQDFDATKLLNDTVELFHAKASEKNITIEIQFETVLPPSLRSDPLRIKQILSNLISNAIKFSPDKSTINIIVARCENRLKVGVKDNGIGIDTTMLSEVFDAFIQEERSTARKFGGTGLGLNISKKLAKLLGGDIYLSSEKGVGSLFELEIDAPLGDEIAIHELDIQKEALYSSANLLVAEDNKTNQMLIHIVLEEIGLKHTIVNDGEEAIQALGKEEYQLVLMDINMPNMDGIDATKVIRRTRSSYQNIPIIALTANAIKGDKENFMSIGMDGYVSKPIDIDVLVHELSKFISVQKIS